MSTFPQVSFSQMLTQYANSAGVSFDPLDTPALDDLSQSTKSKFAGWTNTGMDRLWRNPNPAFAWKWTTTSGPITLQTNGSILWSDIQNSDDFFNLWSVDPRPMDSPPPNLGWYVGNSAFPIHCVEDNQAIWPRVNSTTLYAFWRLPVPQFTSRLVDTTKTYNTIGTLVWDQASAAGSGNVYKSIATGALGSNLTDAAKWVAQTVPYRLSNVLAEVVETMRLGSAGSDGSAGLNSAEADKWLDIEMAKENPRDGNGPVWGYDRRFRGQCGGFNWGF